MKRIGLLVQSLESGGSERSAAMISELLNGKYEIYLLSFTDADVSYHTAGKFYSLDAEVYGNPVTKAFGFLKKAKKLRQYVAREKIDCVFSFGSDANNCLAFSGARCKKILSCRGYGYMKEHKNWYHTLLRRSDGILFNAEEMRTEYREAYPKDAGKLFCLHNVLELARVKKLAQESLDAAEEGFYGQHPVLVNVGRFCKEKNHCDLIKSFCLLKQRIPDARLVLVGHLGAYEQKIREMAKASPYEKEIYFAGYQTNPYRYVRAASVFSLTSFSEGFPNVLIEAMAAGTPIVSVACKTGAKEILADDFSKVRFGKSYLETPYGILTPTFSEPQTFEWNDVSEEHRLYAAALEKMLTDASLQERVKRGAEEKVKSFDRKNMFAPYAELIEKITGKGGRA